MYEHLKITMRLAAVVVLVSLGVPSGGSAQQAATPTPAPAPMTMPMQRMPMQGMPMQEMPMHPMAGATTPAGSEAEKSMMAAMEKMSQTMAAVPMTGNADRDFVAMMIPHHAGAIDMARFELSNGRDPVMRKLAEAIVSAQESEISEMQAWQKAHPGSP